MTIAVDQIIRSRRKTLALIVKPDGSLLVRAPLRTSQKVIREFVEKNREWIEKNRTQALAARAPSPKQYLSGETFLYLGISYPLQIVKGQMQSLLLDGTFKLAESHQANAAATFERWYRQQAGQILLERVNRYASQYDFQFQKIGITSARTRWGSCSATGSLNFSWRLIMAPLSVVDYVVVHELVHTEIHNHSKQFWRSVGTIMPEYKDHRRWLRANGQQLLF